MHRISFIVKVSWFEFLHIYILWLWYYSENIIILVIQVCRQFYWQAFWTTSWSSGRVQDSGLVSRSNPGFNTLPVRLGVPLGKVLHAALLLSTQEQMCTCAGRSVSRGAKLLYTPQGVEMDIQMEIWTEQAQWQGKVLVKVCRAEIWTWMWTQNSDFTYNLFFHELSQRKFMSSVCHMRKSQNIHPWIKAFHFAKTVIINWFWSWMPFLYNPISTTSSGYCPIRIFIL